MKINVIRIKLSRCYAVGSDDFIVEKHDKIIKCLGIE